MAKLPNPEKILAVNLAQLMAHSPDLKSEAKIAAAAKVAKISQRTVNRARNGAQVRLESLAGLAEAFGLAPWQLLVPGLDPANPPILALSQEEKALYKRLQDAAKAINSQG